MQIFEYFSFLLAKQVFFDTLLIMSFVHLHTHTHYTFQRALATPERLAKRARELGQTAIAITDAGTMYGAFEFYEACRAEWIKPIIGVEFQLSKKWRTNRDKDNEIFEIVLLAKNLAGYKNLIELVTLSQKEWYYYGRPRIDFEILEKYHSDLIALSGSMYGEIAQKISMGRDESVLCERIEYYRNLFGKENYYLEIEEHPDKPLQAHINETIINLSKKFWYEYVGTNNSYYVIPDDAWVQMEGHLMIQIDQHLWMVIILFDLHVRWKSSLSMHRKHTRIVQKLLKWSISLLISEDIRFQSSHSL